MEKHERPLLRLAQSIVDNLTSLRTGKGRLLLEALNRACDCHTKLLTAAHTLDLCLARGLQGAFTRTARNIDSPLRNLHYLVLAVEEAYGEFRRIQPPSFREVFESLRQLWEEFDEVHLDVETHLISVETGPIELEGVYLGPFEIRLNVTGLGIAEESEPFRVVALDPHPAAGNSTVTHPHVSNERLCTGDGYAALRTALSAGRICDFFLMVKSILETYNPESPYVSLRSWCGTPCYDCGYVAPLDDLHYCNGCERDFCDECISACNHCGDYNCRGCLFECEACEEFFCLRCITRCENCERQICPNCHEEGRCPCHEENEENEDDKEDNEAPQGDEQTPSGDVPTNVSSHAGSPVLASRVGEAPVLP